MQPTPHTRDERLARELRAQIYAGQPPVGSNLDSAAAIAARRGDMSTAMVQRAFELLAREGLVRQEHGRGTYVCERFRWEVMVGAAGSQPAARQVRDIEQAEPAVTRLVARATPAGAVAWVMEVEAADVVPAVAVAVAVARTAGATGILSVEARSL